MNAPANSQKGTLIAVAVIILGGAVAGVLLGQSDATPAAAPVAEPKAPVTAAPIVVPAAAVPPAATPAVLALSEAELAGLANDSMSGPAPSRIAAIERLSKAPREQALPLLKRALLNGEPGIDRPAALHGLRDLALAQGDADQRIRDAVREVVYHGDDENFAAEAQETIDVIANSETK